MSNYCATLQLQVEDGNFEILPGVKRAAVVVIISKTELQKVTWLKEVSPSNELETSISFTPEMKPSTGKSPKYNPRRNKRQLQWEYFTIPSIFHTRHPPFICHFLRSLKCCLSCIRFQTDKCVNTGTDVMKWSCIFLNDGRASAFRVLQYKSPYSELPTQEAISLITPGCQPMVII